MWIAPSNQRLFRMVSAVVYKMRCTDSPGIGYTNVVNCDPLTDLMENVHRQMACIAHLWKTWARCRLLAAFPTLTKWVWYGEHWSSELCRLEPSSNRSPQTQRSTHSSFRIFCIESHGINRRWAQFFYIFLVPIVYSGYRALMEGSLQVESQSKASGKSRKRGTRQNNIYVLLTR